MIIYKKANKRSDVWKLELDIGLIIKMLLLCAAAFYCVAPNVYYIINMWRFNVPFSKQLVANGVYDEDMHRRLITGRWISIILVTAITVAIAVLLTMLTMPVGVFAAVLSLAAGIFRFRHGYGIKEINIRRFARTHEAVLDKEKFKKFVKQKYNIGV